MNNLNWTAWTDDELPSSTCQFDNFTATVQLITPRKENGYSTRQWKVEGKHWDEATPFVAASGYTMGSANARLLCEAVLYVWGIVQESNKLLQLSTESPRHG